MSPGFGHTLVPGSCSGLDPRAKSTLPCPGSPSPCPEKGCECRTTRDVWQGWELGHCHCPLHRQSHCHRTKSSLKGSCGSTPIAVHLSWDFISSIFPQGSHCSPHPLPADNRHRGEDVSKVPLPECLEYLVCKMAQITNPAKDQGTCARHS